MRNRQTKLGKEYEAPDEERLTWLPRDGLLADGGTTRIGERPFPTTPRLSFFRNTQRHASGRRSRGRFVGFLLRLRSLCSHSWRAGCLFDSDTGLYVRFT